MRRKSSATRARPQPRAHATSISFSRSRKKRNRSSGARSKASGSRGSISRVRNFLSRVRGVRLVFSLQLYWLPRGLIELGYRATVESLARAGAQQRDLHRSGALYAAGQLSFFMGAYPASKNHMEECLAIAHEIGIKEREASAHLMLGYDCEALGETADAFVNFEASAAIARELGDKGRLALALNALAGLHHEARDLDAAVPLFEEALSITRELDDRESISIHLTNLARALVDRGTGERARGLLIEGLTGARENGSPRAGRVCVERQT